MNEHNRLAVRDVAAEEPLAAAGSASVQTEYDLLQHLRHCAVTFGFAQFMLARLPAGDDKPFSELLVLSNWPTALVRSYDLTGAFSASPLVAGLRSSKLPVFGETSLLLMRQGAQASMPHFGTADIQRSFALLLHTSVGEPFIICLSGSRGALDVREMADLCFRFLHLIDMLEKTFVTTAAPRGRLSAREAECLRWAAAGKSSDEIATILAISANTVGSHFKTAARKLNAVNRMQAIACAMRLKLI